VAQFFDDLNKALVMSTNLIERIQQNLAYPPLSKIDPNTQEVKGKSSASTVALISQAAIPAILTAIYRLSRNDAGSTTILNADTSGDAMSVLFEGKENLVMEKVARYAGVSVNQAESHLENIADESIRLLKESVGTTWDPHKVKHYMNGQRHNILVYLPASLCLGDLLRDEGLDDKTNKMEGPVSNFMHRIENTLSQGGN
jgi:hypothetical protein